MSKNDYTRSLALLVAGSSVIAVHAQSPDPATFTIDKHASYTVTTDGWPYAFLPDSGGFYLLVGAVDRAPKALRYDSTGHKGSPRTGIDLTRRSTDLAMWRLEDGKIFNTVFGPPDPNGEKPEEKDGELIWGFVDPTKKDPAEPHVLGTMPNSDRGAPLSWTSASVLSDGHFGIWVVPHMKKKDATALAIAVVNWRTGKQRVQEVILPVAMNGLHVNYASANDAGDVLLSIAGVDPAVKKDGFSEQLSILITLKAGQPAIRNTVKVPDCFAGCVAGDITNSGDVELVGFAVKTDKATPVILRAHYTPGQEAPIDWSITALDDEAARQFADHPWETQDILEPKPEKPDAKDRLAAMREALAKIRPLHLEHAADGRLLFAAEVQVRNMNLGQEASGDQAGNLRDQIVYALWPASGAPRIGVVRKYVVESGAPGFGDVCGTSVLWKGERIHFFFNDWEKQEFAKGKPAPDRYGRINVASLENTGIFDPVVHVEGPDGAIERTAIQRSMAMDFMLNGCVVKSDDGSMLVALTKGRGIQWMKVEVKP